MYVNVILEDSELFVPLPYTGILPAPNSGGGGSSAVGACGLSLSWHQLRMGHFWGGDGESILRINGDALSAAGHLPGEAHGQARCHHPQSISPLHMLCANLVHDAACEQQALFLCTQYASETSIWN